MLDQLRRDPVARHHHGSRLNVRFMMRDQKNPVGIAIDLKGFTEAFDRLTQK